MAAPPAQAPSAACLTAARRGYPRDGRCHTRSKDRRPAGNGPQRRGRYSRRLEHCLQLTAADLDRGDEVGEGQDGLHLALGNRRGGALIGRAEIGGAVQGGAGQPGPQSTGIEQGDVGAVGRTQHIRDGIAGERLAGTSEGVAAGVGGANGGRRRGNVSERRALRLPR